MSQHVFKRAAVLAATVGVTGLLGAGIASAHVTANVYGNQPAKGGYSSIFFRVPNEDPSAGTVKVEVDIKPEYTIGSVSTKPVPGWTVQVTEANLAKPVTDDDGATITKAVDKVIWTAQPGSELTGETFQEFEISAGKLPTNVDQLEFPAVQTYSSGKVVNWNEEAKPGAAEPEHPAPTVKLAAANSGGTMAGMSGGSGDTSTAAASTSDSSDNTARWLGGVGLVLGALGLGLGGGAFLRSRRVGGTK